MKQPKILSLGEVLWDLFPDGERFGGAPANVACHAAILGGEITMVSAVGNDERGQEAVAILNGFGIDTSLIQVDAQQPTGSVGIELDAAGKPQFTIHENAAWDHLAWSSQLAAKIGEANAVYFGTLGQRGTSSRATIRRALDAAKAAGVLCILDVNLRAPFFSLELIRESIEHADVLKLSDDELDHVADACTISRTQDNATILRALVKRFKLSSVVLTRGPEGALFVSADETVDQPGIPTKVVDTVGAGDSFTAALMTGLLQGKDASRLSQDACETASAVCAIPAAIPEIPETV